MAKQETTNLSEQDRQLCGKYLDKYEKILVVIASRNKGKEYLDIATQVGFGKTPLFEKIEADILRAKIKDGLLTKMK